MCEAVTTGYPFRWNLRRAPAGRAQTVVIFLTCNGVAGHRPVCCFCDRISLRYLGLNFSVVLERKVLSKITMKYRIGVITLLPFFLVAIPHSVSAQAPNLGRGQLLFERICAKCHGSDGSKTTSVGKAVKAEDLRSHAVQARTDAELYTQIANGSKNMPPFAGVYRKAQINDLVGYLRELGNEQKAAARVPNLERGEILFERICAKCHGTDGSKTTSVGRAVKAEDLRSPAVQVRTDA